MKKIYMPTMDELYKMQDITDGHSTYKYILIKAIESLVMEGVIYPDKGILKKAYKYLRENPNIAYAVCRMYPEEIKYSEYAQNEMVLCLDLISGKHSQDRSIYVLDNLSYFENGIGVLSNPSILTTTVKTLSDKLPQTPQYRFEYKQNSLLDDIFAREIPVQELSEASTQDFINIEPAYALIANPDCPKTDNKKYILYQSINNYAKRYGIGYSIGNEYYGDDILTSPDENVKRLLKCIKEHNR